MTNLLIRLWQWLHQYFVTQNFVSIQHEHDQKNMRKRKETKIRSSKFLAASRSFRKYRSFKLRIFIDRHVNIDIPVNPCKLRMLLTIFNIDITTLSIYNTFQISRPSPSSMLFITLKFFSSNNQISTVMCWVSTRQICQVVHLYSFEFEQRWISAKLLSSSFRSISRVKFHARYGKTILNLPSLRFPPRMADNLLHFHLAITERTGDSNFKLVCLRRVYNVRFLMT